MTREHIVAEIQRTAAANGDRPLGKVRFLAETGIRESDWLGRYWSKWSEALREAGFDANTLNPRFDNDAVLRALAGEVRRLGRLPTIAEIKLARRRDPSFPSHNVFARLGPKAVLLRRLLDFCDQNAEFADVVALLPVADAAAADDATAEAPADQGFVYLLRSGRYYKIGLTLDMDERVRRLKIQLPDPVCEVHRIATDDPRGIERYWHMRFSDRRKNGEWFELSPTDVAAFRRRRFM